MQTQAPLVTISPEAIADNAIKLIGSDWMLITAGNLEKFNTMTAAWGDLGVLWGRPVATIYVRPGRYTRQFLDQSDLFTLTFFGPQQRSILELCGNQSGRNIDKMHLPGLTPAQTANGAVYFQEAQLVIECRKIYVHDITPENFLAPDIAPWYPERDYHRMYIGQILSCLTRQPG